MSGDALPRPRIPSCSSLRCGDHAVQRAYLLAGFLCCQLESRLDPAHTTSSSPKVVRARTAVCSIRLYA